MRVRIPAAAAANFLPVRRRSSKQTTQPWRQGIEGFASAGTASSLPLAAFLRKCNLHCKGPFFSTRRGFIFGLWELFNALSLGRVFSYGWHILLSSQYYLWIEKRRASKFYSLTRNVLRSGRIWKIWNFQ